MPKRSGLRRPPSRTAWTVADTPNGCARLFAEGQELGITGTPTMLLGVSEGNQVKEVKMLRGAQPFSIFNAEVDPSLAAMAATP